MSDEPLSVQIARLRGCSPYDDGDGFVICGCAKRHHPADGGDLLWNPAGYEAWLEPAASFALLSEITAATDVAISPLGDGFVVEVHAVSWHADTLSLAIALAWVSWKQP